MDMKKEIKLSDLFGRKKKEAPAAEATEAAAEPKKSRFARSEAESETAKAAKAATSLARPSESKTLPPAVAARSSSESRLSLELDARASERGGVPDSSGGTGRPRGPGSSSAVSVRGTRDALAEALRTFFKKPSFHAGGAAASPQPHRGQYFDLTGVETKAAAHEADFAPKRHSDPARGSGCRHHVRRTRSTRRRSVRRVLSSSYRELVDGTRRSQGRHQARRHRPEGFAALRALLGRAGRRPTRHRRGDVGHTFNPPSRRILSSSPA